MKALFFANTDWYLYNFRLPLARFLRDQGVEVVMLSPQGSYGPRLEAEGFRWIPLPMDRRSLNPWREFKLWTRIVRLFWREKPDLVHNFTIKCVVYGGLAAQLVGIHARIGAVTGMGYVFINRHPRARLLRPLVKCLLRLALRGGASKLILQNPDDVQTFTQARIMQPKDIHLVPSSGVNILKFRPAVKASGSSRPFRILLAARLLWDKGVGEFVEAARMLKSKGLAVEFLLAGSPDSGNPASVSAARLDSWAEEGCVKPLGYVEDMAQLYAKVDLVVLPSYREGIPRSLIEAASCGLPIVATDVTGCREVVDHGVNGLLVPFKNARALAEAIRYLYQNPELCARMGAAGRAKVIRQFDEQLVLAKTFAVYQELLPDLGPVENVEVDTLRQVEGM